MKYIVLLVCVLLIVPAMSVACSPAGKDVPISVACDEFQKQKNVVKDVQVVNGDKVVVSLCQQSGSTGYKWGEKAQLGNPQVLEQINYKTVPPEKPMPGAPATDVWTFRAMQPGLCVVDLEYGQPWQGGQKAGWTLKLNVTVK